MSRDRFEEAGSNDQLFHKWRKNAYFVPKKYRKLYVAPVAIVIGLGLIYGLVYHAFNGWSAAWWCVVAVKRVAELALKASSWVAWSAEAAARACGYSQHVAGRSN